MPHRKRRKCNKRNFDISNLRYWERLKDSKYSLDEMLQIMSWPSWKYDLVKNLNLCMIDVIVINKKSIYTLLNLILPQ